MAVTRSLAALTAALLLAAPTAAPAQTIAAGPPVRQTASVNLLGAPFGFASAEYERAVGTSGFAVGLGGLVTFTDGGYAEVYTEGYSDDERFRSLQAKFKYYPATNGLRGFAVGVTAGVASARGGELVQVGTRTIPTPGGSFTAPLYAPRYFTATRPTLGAVLDYNFLIGRQRQFLVGLGVGARRVIGDQARREDIVGGGTFVTRGRVLNEVLPDGRLQVGFGF